MLRKDSWQKEDSKPRSLLSRNLLKKEVGELSAHIEEQDKRQ